MKHIAVAAILALAPATVQAAETLSYDVVFNDSIIAAGTDTLAVGDRVIINDRLLSDGADAGQAAGVCTIVDVESNSAICTVTFTLEAGGLSVQFVNSPPPEKTFPILGGTGAFAGRHGIGTLLEHGDGTGSVNFTVD